MTRAQSAAPIAGAPDTQLYRTIKRIIYVTIVKEDASAPRDLRRGRRAFRLPDASAFRVPKVFPSGDTVRYVRGASLTLCAVGPLARAGSAGLCRAVSHSLWGRALCLWVWTLERANVRRRSARHRQPHTTGGGQASAARVRHRARRTGRGSQIVRNYKQVRTYVPCMRRRFRVSFCLPSIDCIESQCLAQCGRDVVARVRYSRTSTDLRRSPVPRLSLFNACRAPVNASQRARQRGAQPCLLRVPRELPERAAQRSVSPIRAVTWSAATAAGKQRGRRPRGRPWCSCHSSW